MNGGQIQVPRMPRKSSIPEEPRKNKYYIGISRRWRIARFSSLLLLIVFLLAMISFYRSELTVENLRYFIRYLDKSAPEYTGNYRTLYFDSNAGQQLGIYKGELAVADQNSLTLYNMLGNSTLDFSLGYSTPMLLTSNKYMLVWALGENTFTISNAFSQLYTGKTEYPIYGAALSESGMFAIVSNTMEYRSAVYIYDQNFNLVSRILKDKLVMHVAFNSDGSEVQIMSAYSEGGSYVSELMAVNPYSDEPLWTKTLENTLVCRGQYASNGNIMVLTDNSIRMYNNLGEELSRYSFGGLVPLAYTFSSDQCVAVFNQNIVGNDNTVVVIDSSGNLVYSGIHSGQILDIECADGMVYILFDAAVLRISVSDGAISTTAIESGGKSLLIKDSMSLIVCYTQKADTYRIAALFGDEEPDAAPLETNDGTQQSVTEPPESEAGAQITEPETQNMETTMQVDDTTIQNTEITD